MQVTVYGPLRGVTGERAVEVTFEGGTVSAAVEAFVDAHPRARSQLYDDGGTLRSSVRVLRDGERVDPDDPCPADADLALFPAVQGGGRG